MRYLELNVISLIPWKIMSGALRIKSHLLNPLMTPTTVFDIVSHKAFCPDMEFRSSISARGISRIGSRCQTEYQFQG
jgi:hypothetical protein